MKHDRIKRMVPGWLALFTPSAVLLASACLSEADLLLAKDEAGLGSSDGTGASADPVWTSCEPQGSFLDEARTGDRCSFEGGCGAIDEQCEIDEAYCEGGTLYRSRASRDVCEPFDFQGAFEYCLAPLPDRCCIEITECGERAGAPLDVSTVCSLDCQLPAAELALVTACPALDGPWSPEPGTPCEGDFVCGATGHPHPGGPQADVSSGTLYWCAQGAIQRVNMPIAFWPTASE